MARGFMPNTCQSELCSPFIERMLGACVGQLIPDIPPGNRMQGKVMQMSHAAMIRAAAVRSGCLLPPLVSMIRDSSDQPKTLAEEDAQENLPFPGKGL